MRKLAKFTSSAPSRLPWTFAFWVRNHVLLWLILAGVGSVWCLLDLMIPADGEHIRYMPLLIEGLAGWGLWIAIRSVSRMEIDEALARCVDQEAAEELGGLRAHPGARIALGKLKNLIPHNPHWNQGIVRTFHWLLDEARARKFHSASLILQPFRERNFANLFRLQSLQRMALQIGILGTFIGLVYALVDLSRMDVSALETALVELVGSLHLAFGTSIAGLQTAVFLGAAQMFVRRRQESLFSHAESAVSNLSSLARYADNPDDYLVEFQQIRTAMKQLQDKVRGQALATRNQTTEIQAGLAQLTGAKKHLGEFLQEVQSSQAEILSEMKSVYEVVSPKQTAEELGASLERVIDKTAYIFRTEIEQSFAELDRFNDSLSNLKEFMAEVRDHHKLEIRALAQTRDVWAEGHRQLLDLVHETRDLQDHVLGQIREAGEVTTRSLKASPVESLANAGSQRLAARE